MKSITSYCHSPKRRSTRRKSVRKSVIKSPRRKSPRRKSPRRKSPRRKSVRKSVRKSPRRKSVRKSVRKSPRRKSVRKSPRRKSVRRCSPTIRLYTGATMDDYSTLRSVIRSSIKKFDGRAEEVFYNPQQEILQATLYDPYSKSGYPNEPYSSYSSYAPQETVVEVNATDVKSEDTGLRQTLESLANKNNILLEKLRNTKDGNPVFINAFRMLLTATNENIYKILNKDYSSPSRSPFDKVLDDNKQAIRELIDLVAVKKLTPAQVAKEVQSNKTIENDFKKLTKDIMRVGEISA